MKKILFTLLFALSICSVKAQTGIYENIFFTNLYGGMINGNSNEFKNYHISNTLSGFDNNWGLDVKWWGGIKLKTSAGLVYLNRFGNLGINTENPLATLDVNGTITSSGDITGSDLVSSGSNSWIFHTPDDGRKTLHIAPIGQNGYNFFKETTFSDGNIAVHGKLEAIEVKVTQSPTADFVFADNYMLPRLEDVEKYIRNEKHLPEIASAKEMELEGVNVGEFQIKLLQKIEELTLYSIEHNKIIKQQIDENRKRSEEIKEQQEKIISLELENQQFKTLLERVEKLENKEKKNKTY